MFFFFRSLPLHLLLAPHPIMKSLPPLVAFWMGRLLFMKPGKNRKVPTKKKKPGKSKKVPKKKRGGKKGKKKRKRLQSSNPVCRAA